MRDLRFPHSQSPATANHSVHYRDRSCPHKVPVGAAVLVLASMSLVGCTSSSALGARKYGAPPAQPFPDSNHGPLLLSGTDVFLKDPKGAGGQASSVPDDQMFDFSVVAATWIESFSASIAGPPGVEPSKSQDKWSWTYTAKQLRAWRSPITLTAVGREKTQTKPKYLYDDDGVLVPDPAGGYRLTEPAHDEWKQHTASRTWQVIDDSPPGATRPGILMQLIRSEDARLRFGEKFQQNYLPYSVTIVNPEDSKLLVYVNTLQPVGLFVPMSPDGEDWKEILGQYAQESGGQAYQDIIDRGYFEQRVKPESILGVLASFETIKRDSAEQVTVDIMKIMGEFAAVLTPFASGADYSTAVAAYTGVGVPQTEKFLLRDFSAFTKNLQDLAFVDSIIEIPGNSEVTKIVFLPRQPAGQLLPGNLEARLDVILTDRDISVHSTVVEQERDITLGARL